MTRLRSTPYRNPGLSQPSDPDPLSVLRSGRLGRVPAFASPTDPARLLAAVADALNACEAAQVPVKLAHGAVLTPVGYVLPVFPDAGERFAVRTMALTEFPVTPDSGDED